MARYIDVEKLLREYLDLSKHEFPTASGNLDKFLNKDIPNFLRNYVIEDIEPMVYGEWSDSYPYRCSVCNSKAPYEYDAHDNDAIMIKSNYCPGCGARMR